ncbi:hypothetical protein VP14_043 [Vibrio phage VPMCC14]|nr:hypothetical protein VP14_043 [Vibrio phage VPMCC14]
MLLRDIPSDQWVSVNALTGIPVGTKLDLTNQGQADLLMTTSATQPLASFREGKFLKEVESEQSRTTLRSTSEELWIRSNTSTSNGIVLVQEDSYPFTDFGGDLDPRVYTGYQGLTIQPFTEANVKNGTQFTISEEIPILTGQTIYRGLKTPNDGNDVLVKTRIINTDGGMRYTPHSSQTGVVVGTDKSNLIVNLNSKSSNVSNCQYYDITSVISEGPFFDVVRSTAGVGSNRQQGIFAGLGIERVLNQDTEYLLKFENLDNKDIYVVFSVTFYVGPLSPDII